MQICINEHTLTFDVEHTEVLDKLLHRLWMKNVAKVAADKSPEDVTVAAEELLAINTLRVELAERDQEILDRVVDFDTLTIEVESDKDGCMPYVIPNAEIKRAIEQSNGQPNSAADLTLRVNLSRGQANLNELGVYHMTATYGRRSKDFKLWLVPKP